MQKRDVSTKSAIEIPRQTLFSPLLRATDKEIFRTSSANIQTEKSFPNFIPAFSRRRENMADEKRRKEVT